MKREPETSVIGNIVVKRGVPPPAPAPRRGRRQRWASVWDAIPTLRPGDWFAVAGAKELAGLKKNQLISVIRQRMIHQGLADTIECYATVDGDVIVRCIEQGGESLAPRPRTRSRARRQEPNA
ncbi:MAG: hypothetical protein ACK4WH_00870 [Phycisphaerales bacterium]